MWNRTQPLMVWREWTCQPLWDAVLKPLELTAAQPESNSRKGKNMIHGQSQWTWLLGTMESKSKTDLESVISLYLSYMLLDWWVLESAWHDGVDSYWLRSSICRSRPQISTFPLWLHTLQPVSSSRSCFRLSMSEPSDKSEFIMGI